MPQALTLEKLNGYQEQLKAGRLADAIEVYGELYAQGYNYAGWGRGVATGDTVTGVAALDFLSSTAMLGIGSELCKNLSASQINRIRVNMAQGYVDKLIVIAKKEKDVLTRDVRFDETQAFHATAFEKNGLTIDNWTLHTPMELIRAIQGEAAVEKIWQTLRDTGGDGPDSLIASTWLANRIGRLAFSSDPNIAAAAQAWGEQTPGFANFTQMGKSITAVITSIFGDSGVTTMEAYLDQAATHSTITSLTVTGTTDGGVTAHATVNTAAPGAPRLYDVSSTTLTQGALSGHTISTTTNTQTGEVSHHWQEADGSRSRGNVAANGNVSFLDKNSGALHIYKGGDYVGSFGLDHMSLQINGVQGRYTYDPASGVITGVTSSVGGAPIYGFTATRHSDDGRAWSAPTFDFSDRQAAYDADHAAWDALSKGLVDRRGFENLVNASTSFLVNPSHGFPNFGNHHIDSLWNPHKLPTFVDDHFNSLHWNPLGAFYESSSPGLDTAASIADKTFLIMDGDGVGVTADELAARDADGDGRLSGAELDGLQAASDLREDGVFFSLKPLRTALLSAGLNSLSAGDYAIHAAGKVRLPDFRQHTASAPLEQQFAPTAEPSRWEHLYTARSEGWFPTPSTVIFWQRGQVRISRDQQSMVGTDGNDNFDINYYAHNDYKTGAYGRKYFDLSRVKNFYAGAGNDVVGGSERNDKIWGGTGNDTLFGYGGDDILYGEEGNDELQGGAGNDLLDGGTGNDRLFGGVGNDTLIGGDGDDILIGFNSSNDARQTLAPGETDDDTMFGGRGNDQMYGGPGNDRMWGEDGNDLLVGGDGDDVMSGGNGDDDLSGGNGHDIMTGDAGNDRMFGGAGNDRMWGGDGDDIMLGFTAGNEAKQTLAPGETDDDIMYGGAGNDLMLGGPGNDRMWGGDGNDELQGGDGDDLLYGEQGNDRLFGDAGNDRIWGGAGDDLLAGDDGDDFLFGGAGNDTLLGGTGNDYLDGGSGADHMEGGAGDDIYIVNSVNDVVLEHEGEGYDTVISSTNTILSAHVEELRLVEGHTINGTGNRLNNRLIGNSQDNILDGVTGADVMIGGRGNDTYYVDDIGDQVVELADEGIDTVNASISYTLTDHVENLTLLDFSKPERGIADGVDILVYGYPKAFELDYMQGDAVPGYKGTCALTAIANLSTQANQTLTEAQVVRRAIDNGWTVTDPAVTDSKRGGSNHAEQQALLDSYGIRNGLLMGYDEQAVANLLMGGRGVVVALNSGSLWDDDAYPERDSSDHVVTVTGVAYAAKTGDIAGFYIADSGRGKVSDMTRYVPVADFRKSADVANAYSIYTIDPIKLWEENIDGAGNALDNVITGNRGDNVLTGGKGNDTLIGGRGNDTYMFARGDGRDTIVDNDATAGNRDVLRFTDVNQDNLWLTREGADLRIDVMGGDDRITVRDWYVDGADNQIECIETADGLTLYNTDVEQLVQAMASFAPPAAAQTSWTRPQEADGRILLTALH